MANHCLKLRTILPEYTGSTYTLSHPHSNQREECIRLHDSIRTEFSRLALSKTRTYQELLALKGEFSPYNNDEELHHAAGEIRPFFNSLDNLPLHKGNKEEILAAYRMLLTRTIRNGIHSRNELITYITKEDAIFRAFLSHLHDFEGESMADITRGTEQCCSQIFFAAERKEITYREAMLYLTMRTNRRQIQNMQICIEDVRNKKIKTSSQAHAYIWMLIHPYTSLDGFSMTLLSDKERKQLDRMAAQTPVAFKMNMLRHFFNDFMTFVPLQLPQLLDVTTMEEAQFYGDYALLTFPLRDPYDLEEVMDLFEDDMELITLYHHIPTHADKFGHSTCAYSNPAFGQMFKMNCKTDADGKVNSILVTIYDSLEQMYGELCLDLDLHSKSGTFKYKKNKDDLLMDFL